MTQAATFLSSFGRALSSTGLYSEGHPTLQRAIETAWRDLGDLLAVAPRPTFTFLGDSVLFGDVPLDNRKGWEWSDRLAAAGIQRVEFETMPERQAFESFLLDVSARSAGHKSDSGHSPSAAVPAVRYGAVGLRDDGTVLEAPVVTATLAFALDAEIDTVRWVHEEVTGGRSLPLAEVEAIVDSLSVAMHGDARMVLPLVELKEYDQYTTAHSLNVSVLAMGLAERLGQDGGNVRALGIAALLHDLGKTLIPRDILNKPGRFSDAERELMNRHPVDGARLILQADEALDLAATVAYEHHIMISGGGYPVLRYPRACHEASRLVHVCDVFDALRTRRPYREAWSVRKAVKHLSERSRIEFDPHLVGVFTAMIVECGATVPAEQESCSQ
jgi:putative nucleotidyltransferase with HDIG domain